MKLQFPQPKLTNFSLALSIALFVTCFFFPAYEVAGKSGPYLESPLEVLITGWLGAHYSMLEWYANPLLLISWLLAIYKSYALSFLSALGAIYLGLSFLARKQMVLDTSPNYGDITGHGPGYWLWIASMALSLFTATAGAIAVHRKRL